MKPDRVADIPIRHLHVDYVCTVGYSQQEDSFILVNARYANPGRSDIPKNGDDLYLRILNEPALRANLLQSLIPDATAQISDLREKAIWERGNSVGLTAGLAAFAITGYLLYQLTLWLSRYVGYELAGLITYIPMFFAIVVMFPVQTIVRRWHSRRYCNTHSHLLKSIKNANGAEASMCMRCGLYFLASSDPFKTK